MQSQEFLKEMLSTTMSVNHHCATSWKQREMSRVRLPATSTHCLSERRSNDKYIQSSIRIPDLLFMVVKIGCNLKLPRIQYKREFLIQHCLSCKNVKRGDC